MLNQLIAVTLRLLLFRAGPQDIPYAPALALWMPAAAIATYFILFRTVLPTGAALVLASVSVAALSFVTHSLLSARRVANRFQQTYHALLATSIVLTLASVPPMVALLRAASISRRPAASLASRLEAAAGRERRRMASMRARRTRGSTGFTT